MRVRRMVATTVIAGLIAPAVPLSADVTHVRCESGAFGRYRECPVRTEGRVELVRELSRNRCHQWQSWGYDRDGVWVDNGCRAEFRVGKEGIGAGTGVAIGAIAGAAIIGAILSGKQKDHKDDVVASPEWARGRFQGFSPKHETEFDLTIARDGNVTGYADGKAVTGHVSSNNRLHVGDLEFEMRRESWGFAAKQRDDGDNVIYFRRQ